MIRPRRAPVAMCEPETEDQYTLWGRIAAVHELEQLGIWVREASGYDSDDARDEIARAIENRVRELRASGSANGDAPISDGAPASQVEATAVALAIKYRSALEQIAMMHVGISNVGTVALKSQRIAKEALR